MCRYYHILTGILNPLKITRRTAFTVNDKFLRAALSVYFCRNAEKTQTLMATERLASQKPPSRTLHDRLSSSCGVIFCNHDMTSKCTKSSTLCNFDLYSHIDSVLIF